MSKKVRVIKEMSFVKVVAKVGEEFELDKNNGLNFVSNTWFNSESIEKMVVDEGLLEYVEEDKSLEDELNMAGIEMVQFEERYVSVPHCLRIVKKRYLDVFDKTKDELSTFEYSSLTILRKALEEA